MSANPAVRVQRNLRTAPKTAFCAQQAFLDSLSIERQRCERAGSLLLLALICLEEIPEAERGDVAEKVVAAIRPVPRSTDVHGWYRENRTVGIVFTSLQDKNIKVAQAKVQERIDQALAAELTPDEMAQLKISYHLYPSPAGTLMPDDPALDSDTARPCNTSKYRIIKRSIDIAGSLIGLMLAAPLFAVIAILVKLTSQGPVIFRQTRIGQGGRPFQFLKFRSMYVNNDHSIHRDYVTRMIGGQKVAYKDGSPTGLYKIIADPRITRVGALLRKTSLDELPQLINVLRGEMSLIGPRPPLPYEVEQYRPVAGERAQPDKL
jgi:lipopolysaccharide/colanic/teichoic acid biosynthesis glycosyltransferase